MKGEINIIAVQTSTNSRNIRNRMRDSTYVPQTTPSASAAPPASTIPNRGPNNTVPTIAPVAAAAIVVEVTDRVLFTSMYGY